MDENLKPLKEAGRITKLLDHVWGEDRFDKPPLDIADVALEYSKSIAPLSPIHKVVKGKFPGCVGALVYGDTNPRQWAIMYDENQSPGRRQFTIGHEFGHYILHRKLIEDGEEFENGIYCDENSVNRRDGKGIEKEADEFAASILMPLHDFRRNISAKDQPDFEKLSTMASRYGVSLTAAVLRWLEYTETRSMLVVSNEGFAQWAKSSDAAFKSGRFLRTKNDVFELPSQAIAVRREFTEEGKKGIRHSRGVWFDEPIIEMCVRSNSYDLELTLLHFENEGPKAQAEEITSDTYDRFMDR